MKGYAAHRMTREWRSWWKEELRTLRLEEILLARLNGGRVQFPTFDSDDEAED